MNMKGVLNASPFLIPEESEGVYFVIDIVVFCQILHEYY